jgi:hypothetical protein
VHDVLPIERAEIEALERSGMSRKEAIAAIREIPDADPARTIDRLQLKAGNLAREFFHRNTVDVRGNITGEGFASLFRDIRAERWRDFTKWMVAQHSLEIARKGKLTNLAKEDFLHAAEAIEQRYPEVRDHARRLREFFDRVFDYAIEGGLFTREQVERFKHVSRDPETGQVMDRGYQFYIPFDRVMEPGISQTRLQSRPPVGSSVRTQKGSTHAEIQDPRTSIETLLHRIITDVHRGMAVKSVLKFGLVHKWTGGFVTEVARDRVASQVTMVEIAKQLLQSDNPSAKEVGKVISELIESGDDLGGAITLWDLAKEPRGNRPIISYTPHFTDAEIRALPNKMAQGMARDMNHQLLWLELDREAFNAMRDLGVTQGIVDTWPGFARGLARGPATIKRAGATGLNPIFSVAQIPLDALMKFLSSERSMPLGVLSALGYSIRGMAQILRGSDGAKLWQRLGGGFGQTFTGTELAASMRTGTLSGSKAAEQVQNIADTLSVSEKGNRLDEFEFVRERALAEGRSEEQANALAMEAADKVTIAFTRGGTQARAYGQLVAFFKAGINASEAFFRLFSGAEGAEKQQRAIRRAFFGIALPAIAYWWLNKDEPWFQDLTEEDRLNYWWLKVPGMDSPLRFKKGSVGMVFSSSMETILGLATEKDPVGVSDLVAQTATSFLPSNFLPDTGAPVLEWAWNRSLFSGRPTVPEWMEKHRVPADQGMPFTRTPSWWLGRVLNLSPAKIERAAETFTGGLYGRGLDLLEGIGTLAGATTSEGFSARKLPIIGQAFVRGGMRSRAVETLYDLHRDLEQRHGSGVLDFRGQEARNITQNVIDRIAALHRAGGAGQLTRQQVRDQAAELARQALQSIRR